MKAAGEGLMPPGPDGPELLSLRMGEELLRSLETREWGKPLALGKVIVREHVFLSGKTISLTYWPARMRLYRCNM